MCIYIYRIYIYITFETFTATKFDKIRVFGLTEASSG
jgi:hypothetical protein